MLYLGLVAEVALGKRLPQAVYLHRETISQLDAELLARVTDAANGLPSDVLWNVLKLYSGEPKMSFLWYPRFFEEAFPVLERSTNVDISSGVVTSREYGSENPPILHRKEVLLPHEHPTIPKAAGLTAEAERFGLFDATHDIGHRRGWEERLRRIGLRVHEGHLVPDIGTSGTVFRHRTALSRSGLSTPMQALWRHGFLAPERTVFDYGCGRGDDVRALAQHGLDVRGWDPHFASDVGKREADVVNLGFVLNVIEDPIERAAALRGAWSLTKTVLAVAVLIGGRDAYERCRLFGDGVLTSRGTFQKHFSSTEFRTYLEATLAREPIALAPGIAFVFRDDVDEQSFLSRRVRRHSPVSNAPPRVPPSERALKPLRGPRVRRPDKWETHAELADAFWSACISLGRLPEPDEFDRHVELRETIGSPGTVLRALINRRGRHEFDESKVRRRSDLLVFLALNFFERRRSLHALPESVRRDVKAFFGTYQAAQVDAQALLFSVGKPEAIQRAAEEAAKLGCGYLDGSHSFQLHASIAADLPSVLRVYLGCAARLFGDVENADLVKLHIRSGKVSLMTYDDFDGRSLPDLIERVKINLRTQQIDFFAYGGADSPSQPLYLKSRFMNPEAPNYEEQHALDARLLRLPGLDLSRFGPTRAACEATIVGAGLDVAEFDRRWDLDDNFNARFDQ